MLYVLVHFLYHILEWEGTPKHCQIVKNIQVLAEKYNYTYKNIVSCK